MSHRPAPATRAGVHQDAGRLPRCTGCALPVEACICAELRALPSRTRVVVRMHRVESTKLTNTGRLVPRLVEGARVEIVGLEPASEPVEGERRLLLFPSEGAPPLEEALAERGPVTLLVPDGSWSQARRIAHHELRRHDLALVSLPDPSDSRYRLRRKPKTGGLATLEAVAHALGVLEGPHLEQHLLAAFDRFVGVHLALRAGEGARLGNARALARRAALAGTDPGEALSPQLAPDDASG
jgi:DTW domain-containing protein YfiP